MRGPRADDDVTVGWLFPGQGSQYVGMAGAWSARVPAAAAAVSLADDVLGFDLSGLVARGPAEQLADTYNQQPAVLAASVAVLRAVADRVPRPTMVAGHSLGEYSALVAAGAVAYPDALRLVRERGRLMRRAGELSPGGMAAVLGLDDVPVRAVCDATPGVQVANYNAPGQVVISGTREAVAIASEALRDRGAKRVVELPITIAAHSELMRPVADEFTRVLAATPIAACAIPVVANVTARAVTSVEAVRAELAGQLTASVRWTDSVRAMIDAGIREFYEIGPGNVLTGLVKRIAKSDGVDGIATFAMGEPET